MRRSDLDRDLVVLGGDSGSHSFGVDVVTVAVASVATAVVSGRLVVEISLDDEVGSREHD